MAVQKEALVKNSIADSVMNYLVVGYIVLPIILFC